MTDKERTKFSFLGFSAIVKPPWNVIEKTIAQNLNAFSRNFDYESNTVTCGKEVCALGCTEETMREEARKFYEDNFRLHDVLLVDIKYLEHLTRSRMRAADFYSDFINHCIKCSIFDIPLSIGGKSGDLMVGETRKVVICVPDSLIPESIGKQIPFTDIELNGKPSIAMMVTYVHELMHVLLESRPGYARSLECIEVLSVFIECVFAEKLKQEESDSLKKMRATYEMSLLILSHSSREVEKSGVIHAIGSLMGLKLYEKYHSERKDKRKREYFDDIQRIIDGEMTVDDLLVKRGITVNGALDPIFIKRYL